MKTYEQNTETDTSKLITMEELTRAIRYTKNEKACGPDSIP